MTPESRVWQLPLSLPMWGRGTRMEELRALRTRSCTTMTSEFSVWGHKGAQPTPGKPPDEAA